MTVSIRDAHPDDADAIAAISRAGWTAAYGDLLGAAFVERRAASDLESEWRTYLHERPPQHGLLVAEMDGEVVGFVRFGSAEEGATGGGANLIGSEGNAVGADLAAAGPDGVDGIGGTGGTGSVAEIYGFYVSPPLTGRGIGRKLFASARSALAEGGFRQLVVWTFDGDRRAEAFYARAGLAPDGAQRPEEESGVTERRWRGRLRPP